MVTTTNSAALVFGIGLLCIFLQAESCMWSTEPPPPSDPELGMNSVEEVIQYYGYPVETHVIQTKDGYLLKVQRIPYGKDNASPATGRPPVILEHGLFANAACWVFNTPDKNLAYVLAENGYDVWISNMRGTPGTEHVNLTTSDKAFWRFSWDQMGDFDIPAIIDYILDETGADKVSYVGHSLGTTVAMATLSTHTEYNDKVRILVQLAPSAYYQYVKTPVKELSNPLLGTVFFNTINQLDDGEFNVNGFITDLKNAVCKLKIVEQTLCKDVVTFLFGPEDSRHFNESHFDVFLHFLPQSTSVRNFRHITQLMKSYEFNHYDFGYFGNMKKYNGQTTPPHYDVTKITAPVALYQSVNDYWAQPKDVQRIAAQLPNLVRNVTIASDTFSHLDFIWSQDVNDLLYNQVLDTMKSFL